VSGIARRPRSDAWLRSVTLDFVHKREAGRVGVRERAHTQDQRVPKGCRVHRGRNRHAFGWTRRPSFPSEPVQVIAPAAVSLLAEIPLKRVYIPEPVEDAGGSELWTSSYRFGPGSHLLALGRALIACKVAINAASLLTRGVWTESNRFGLGQREINPRGAERSTLAVRFLPARALRPSRVA
jgi:hypothetical protein